MARAKKTDNNATADASTGGNETTDVTDADTGSEDLEAKVADLEKKLLASSRSEANYKDELENTRAELADANSRIDGLTRRLGAVTITAGQLDCLRPRPG